MGSSQGIVRRGESVLAWCHPREALGTVTLPLPCFSMRLRLELKGSHPSLTKYLLVTFEKSADVTVLSFPSVTWRVSPSWPAGRLVQLPPL